MEGKICSIIKKLSSPYTGLKQTQLRVNINTKKTYVSLFIDAYVHCVNMTLQQLSGSWSPKQHYLVDTKMNYLETIFELLGLSKIACTGKIGLRDDLLIDDIKDIDNIENIDDIVSFSSIDTYIQDGKKFDGFVLGSKYIPGFDIEPKEIVGYSISMREMALQFYKRLEESTCKYGDFTFNSIALNNMTQLYIKDTAYFNSGHANILLIMKNSKTREIKFMLYEPHGSDVDSIQITLLRKSSNKFINLLKFHIKQIYRTHDENYNITILEPAKISCPKGIQVYVNDRLGYCTLISTFWIYLVLGLFSSPHLDPEDKIYLFSNLNVVETCLYETYRNPKELYGVVVSFSKKVIDNYLKLLQPDQSDEFYDLFYTIVKQEKSSQYAEAINDQDSLIW
jgi:hypothetical protein